MRASDIQIGGTYLAKVSGKMATVQVLNAVPHAVRRAGRMVSTTIWVCRNLATDRRVMVKSPQRLRERVG